jgi:hypothetical protein
MARGRKKGGRNGRRWAERAVALRTPRPSRRVHSSNPSLSLFSCLHDSEVPARHVT